MKKLLGIVVLGLLFGGNAYANIFSCTVDDRGNKFKFVITVDENKISGLVSIPRDDVDSESKVTVLVREGYMAKIIITESNSIIKKGSYDLFVFENQKKDGTDYFKAIYSPKPWSGLIHTLNIDVTDPNLPIYFHFLICP
jgi:hypothetical protein